MNRARGSEEQSISNNSAITVTAIRCNYNNSNQFAKSSLTLQQIASIIVCQHNTKILYNRLAHLRPQWCRWSGGWTQCYKKR